MSNPLITIVLKHQTLRKVYTDWANGPHPHASGVHRPPADSPGLTGNGDPHKAAPSA